MDTMESLTNEVETTTQETLTQPTETETLETGQNNPTETTAEVLITPYPTDYLREDTYIVMSVILTLAISIVGGILIGQSLLSKWKL